jgi:hypothetical protein
MALQRVEAQLVGSALVEEVNGLVEVWGFAQDALLRAAGDPKLAGLVGAGAGNFAAVEQRVRELTRGVQAELEALRVRTAEWAAQAVPRHVSAGSTAAMESAVRQGAQFVAGGALGIANTATIRLIMEDLLMDTEFAASSSERMLRRHFRQTQQLLVTESALNEALLISEARLENVSRRTARLMKVFERVGAGQLINVNGRFYQLKSYARLVGNTRLAEAASEASFNAVLSLGTDLVQISDHGRTDPKCDIHAGKVYSISGGDKRFPRLKARPPYHPNCRHIMLPFISELKTEREMEFARLRSAGKIEPGVSIVEYFQNAAS